MIDNESLAADLEALLFGTLNEEEFRQRYTPQAASPALDAIWGNLEHYLSDGDIRARDSSYRDMQDGELRKLIQLLRHGAPMAQIRRINFLRPG